MTGDTLRLGIYEAIEMLDIASTLWRYSTESEYVCTSSHRPLLNLDCMIIRRVYSNHLDIKQLYVPTQYIN